MNNELLFSLYYYIHLLKIAEVLQLPENNKDKRNLCSILA